MINLVAHVLEDEDFQASFCEGCEMKHREHGNDVCPADLDPSDSGCIRRGAWLDIRGILLRAERDAEAKAGGRIGLEGREAA
jgi:hypothetical protein